MITESEMWEKMLGKKFCSVKLNIEGMNKPLPFDVYDGHAICENYKGNRYDMSYPQMKAIKDSDELANAIIDYIDDIHSKEEISIIHILIAFNTIHKNGWEIIPQ